MTEHRTYFVSPGLSDVLRRDPRAKIACPHCLAPPMHPCRDLRGYIVPMHKRRGPWAGYAP